MANAEQKAGEVHHPFRPLPQTLLPQLTLLCPFGRSQGAWQVLQCSLTVVPLAGVSMTYTPSPTQAELGPCRYFQIERLRALLGEKERALVCICFWPKQEVPLPHFRNVLALSKAKGIVAHTVIQP